MSPSVNHLKFIVTAAKHLHIKLYDMKLNRKVIGNASFLFQLQDVLTMGIHNVPNISTVLFSEVSILFIKHSLFYMNKPVHKSKPAKMGMKHFWFFPVNVIISDNISHNIMNRDTRGDSK